MKKLSILALFVLLYFINIAQIYAPQGLNMPGTWNGWTNPPSNNLVLAGIQANGGTLLPSTGLGQNHYQTIINTPTNIAAGSYTFLFTSGPSTNYFQNKWAGVNVTMNTIQSYSFNTGADNSITLANNKYYIVNWEDKGYVDTRAIFMEMSASPVSISSVDFSPLVPQANEDVTVNVTLSAIPAAEEKFYLRYTINGWASSNVVEVSFGGTSQGTATIPGQTQNKTVEFYVFSTSVADLTGFSGNDYDLVTINLNNNNNQNYQYSVPAELTCSGNIGTIEPNPIFPLQDGSVVLTFDAAQGNQVLAGYDSDVYAHIGVITDQSSNDDDWKYTKTEWGTNTQETKFTIVGTDMYQLTISNIRQYFGVPSNETIKKIVMVVRSGLKVNGNYLVAKEEDGTSFYIDVYSSGLNIKILNPTNKHQLLPSNTIVPVCAYSFQSTNIRILIDNDPVSTTINENITYGLNTASYPNGSHMLVAHASDGTNNKYDTVFFYIRGDVQIEELPNGVVEGINYIDNNTVTLVLEDPSLAKQFAFVIGDFNNWQITDQGYMKRTPDGKHYWVTITGLTSGTEYAFQYYIDGELKLADPYSQKILDPWNDQYIPSYNYPNLKQYPKGKTTGIVSIMQTNQTAYNWQVANFTPQALGSTQPDLIIYEMHFRDFTYDQTFNDAIQKLDYLKDLGINAIEVMPVQEFEGNSSWGYNPNFYFAVDKYYGPKNNFKQFVDECHLRGIAVIVDVVYNHAFGTCPLVQMYWDKQKSKPANNNAWFNSVATHPYSPGYDFNHESLNTKKYIKRALKFWLQEYKIDGFRFDLSKGFTQNWSGESVEIWNQTDQSRINILTDYYNHIKSINSNAYVILEHLGNDDEESTLANTGFLLWGNMNHQYNQITMGWSNETDISRSLYSNRGFSYPNLIPYMESHDEERLMYKNINFGNGIIKELPEALQRCAGIYTIYAAIPGPKMIWQFGELGYDYSINYCEDGSISDDCRTSPKPVRWSYFNNIDRKQVYNVYSIMNYLKTTYPAFRPASGNFSWDINNGYGKRVWVSSQNFNAVIAANFGVTAFDMQMDFQKTGTWYNLFEQTSIDVQNTNMTLHFEPGDYYVFTDVYVPLTIENKIVLNQINIFPNPSSDYLTIQSEEDIDVTIFDVQGRKVLNTKANNNYQTIDISILQPGVYTIILKDSKTTHIQKIVKH